MPDLRTISRRLIQLIVYIALFSIARTAWAQENPNNVVVCELAEHPLSHDGKTISVRATLSVFFEDFSLVTKDCGTRHRIWVAFGGDVPGIVQSTWNDNFRKPGVDFKMNGVSYGIKKDDNFWRLYALIAARHGNAPLYSVTATLTGTFLAGKEFKMPNGAAWLGGFGHLYCCSLFIITQVSNVQSVPPVDPKIRGTVLGPDGRPLEGFVVIDEVLGGSPPQRQETTTNGKGEFEFSNSGPLLRFKNPSYRPVAVAVEPGGVPVVVKLEDSKPSDWIVPTCGQLKTYGRRVGFSARFVVPMTFESELNENDGIPFAYYYIYPRGSGPPDAPLTISKSTGQEPDDPSDFVDSDTAEQRWIKDSAGTIVGLDSRGRFRNGKHWRTVNLDRDSIAYPGPAKKYSRALDEIIDSGCILKR